MGDNKNEGRSAAANKRERAKQARGRRKSASGELDWRSFDWEGFAALTVALANSGGAIRVGATRDGGAWALGIYKGDDYATEYIKPAEDVQEAMLEIAEAWLDDWKTEMAAARRTLFGEPTQAKNGTKAT